MDLVHVPIVVREILEAVAALGCGFGSVYRGDRFVVSGQSALGHTGLSR